MTLKDLKDWDKDDVLRLVGLQTRRDAADWILPTVAVFGVGVLVGAGVGLLLAPKPGRELREDVRKRLEAASEQIGHSFSPQEASSDQPHAS